MRVSLLWPDSCNSCNISPIPRNTQNEILVLAQIGPLASKPVFGVSDKVILQPVSSAVENS